MFHVSSPYFLDLFFRFSLNFPNVKNSNCFHHRQTDVCKHTGKGKTFYSNEFLCKKYMNQLHGFCVNRSTASAVWHTNAFILSGYKGNYMMPSVFFELPQKEMPRQPKRNSSGETVSTGTA